MNLPRLRIKKRHNMGAEQALHLSIAMHDMRNLLSVISGNIELLLLDSIPTKVRNRLVIVLDAIHSAGGLASSTLRTTRNAEQSAPNAVSVSQTLEKCLALYTATVPSNIRLELDFQDEPLTVLAEAGHIQIIVMNLVINAVEAIDRKSGYVRVGVRACGDKVLIQVEDDGPGLRPGSINELFEPFESVGKGLDVRGLGLASVQEGVRGIGGTIEVESRPFKSTVFSIYLPLA